MEDIPVLAEHLLQRLAADLGRGEIVLSPDSMKTLQDYPWPGNIRELRNVLERAILLCEKDALGPGDLAFDHSSGPLRADDSNLTLQELERRHIERVLQEEHGQFSRAAVRLGIPKSTLYQKVKKYGIVLSKT